MELFTHAKKLNGGEGREARVIRLSATRPFSRETLAQLARWTRTERVFGRDLVLTVLVATAIHTVLFAVLWAYKAAVHFDPDARSKRQVKVSFFEGRGKATEIVQKGEEIKTPRMPSEPETKRAAPKGAAGSKVPSRKEVALPRTTLTRDFGASTQGPFAVPVPEVASPPPAQEPTAGPTEAQPTTQVAPPTTSKGLRNLLPGGSKDYLERQRTIGDVMGQGPVGGDVPETQVTPDPEKRPIIVEREYALSHYFDKLGRRFKDAWGPERTLPPNTTFSGVTGESVDYDIVINRDGSLRKITNVTALRQPWRRFEDVDRIVLDVFSNVFPLDQVPSRIHQDPVVIRKRIQYTGYRYSIF